MAKDSPKTPGDEEFKRHIEELMRTSKIPLGNDAVTGPKVVIDPAPDRLRRFGDVATPPPGVEVSRGPGVWQKNPEEKIDEAFKRLEEQRRREAELFERLDQLKSIRLAVPRLAELPEPPLAISPWQWVFVPRPIAPQPIRSLDEGRRKVPA